MLDGGFNRWNALNLRTETKTNPFVHKVFRGKTNPRILADIRRIGLKKPGKNIIIDARSAGDTTDSVVRAATAGHIPDSINIDWNANLAQDTFKSIDQLQDLYHKIPKGAEIITYCQGGLPRCKHLRCPQDVRVQECKDVSRVLGRVGQRAWRTG